MSASITGVGVIAPPRHGMRFPPSQSSEAPAVAAEPTGAFAVAKEDSQSKQEEAAEAHSVLRPESRTAIVPSLVSRQLAALCGAALRAKVQAHLRTRTRALTAAVPTRAWLESHPPARSHHSYVFADAVRHTDTPTGAPGELLPSTLTWHAADWRVQTVLHPMSTHAPVDWREKVDVRVEMLEGRALTDYEQINPKAEELERTMRDEFLKVYFGSTWQENDGAARKIQDTLAQISEQRDVARKYVQNTRNVKSTEIDKIMEAFKVNYPNVEKTVVESGAKNLLEYEAMRLLPGYERPAAHTGKPRAQPAQERWWRLDSENSQAKYANSRRRLQRKTQWAAWMSASYPNELARVTAMVVKEHLCMSSEWKRDGGHCKTINDGLVEDFRSRATAVVNDIEANLEATASLQSVGVKGTLESLKVLHANAYVPERPSCTEIIEKHAHSVLSGLLGHLGSGTETLTDVSDLWDVAGAFKMRIVKAAVSDIEEAIQKFRARAEQQFDVFKQKAEEVRDLRQWLLEVNHRKDDYDQARLAFESFECSRQFVAARNAAGKKFRKLIELSDRLSDALAQEKEENIQQAKADYVKNRETYIRAAVEMAAKQSRAHQALKANWLKADTENLKTRHALSTRRAELRYDLSRFGARCRDLDHAEDVQFETEMIQEEGRKRAVVEMYSHVAILGEILSLEEHAGDSGNEDQIAELKAIFAQMHKLTQVLYPPSTMRELDNTLDHERVATGSDGRTIANDGGFLTGELSGPAAEQRSNRAEDWWPAVSHLGQAASTTFNTMFKQGTGDEQTRRDFLSRMELDSDDETTTPQRAYTPDMLAFALRKTTNGVEAKVKRAVDADLQELQEDLEELEKQEEAEAGWFKAASDRLRRAETQNAKREEQYKQNAKAAVQAYFQLVATNATETAQQAGFRDTDGSIVSIRRKQYATTYKHARQCDALAFMQAVLDETQEALYNEQPVPWKPAITFVKAEHVLHETHSFVHRLADNKSLEEVMDPDEDWLIDLADEQGNVRWALPTETLEIWKDNLAYTDDDILKYAKPYRNPLYTFGKTLRAVGVYPMQWDRTNHEGIGFDWDDGGFTRKAGVPGGKDPSFDPDEETPHAPFAATVRDARTADEPPTFWWRFDDADGGAAYLTRKVNFERTGMQFRYHDSYHGPWMKTVSQRYLHIGVPHPELVYVSDAVESEKVEYKGLTVTGPAKKDKSIRTLEAAGILNQVHLKEMKLHPSQGSLFGFFRNEQIAEWWQTRINFEQLTKARKDLFFKMAVQDGASVAQNSDPSSEDWVQAVAQQFDKLKEPTNGAFVKAITDKELDLTTSELKEHIEMQEKRYKEKEANMREKSMENSKAWVNESLPWKMQIAERKRDLSYLRNNPAGAGSTKGWAYDISKEKEIELRPCEYREATRIMQEEKYAGIDGNDMDLVVEHLSGQEAQKADVSLLDQLKLQGMPHEVQKAVMYRWLRTHGMTRSEAVQRGQQGEEEGEGESEEEGEGEAEEVEEVEEMEGEGAAIEETDEEKAARQEWEAWERGLDPDIQTRDDLRQNQADADYMYRKWEFRQQYLRLRRFVEDKDWLERFTADAEAQKAIREVIEKLTQNQWIRKAFGTTEQAGVEGAEQPKRRRESSSNDGGAYAAPPDAQLSHSTEESDTDEEMEQPVAKRKQQRKRTQVVIDDDDAKEAEGQTPGSSSDAVPVGPLPGVEKAPNLAARSQTGVAVGDESSSSDDDEEEAERTRMQVGDGDEEEAEGTRMQVDVTAAVGCSDGVSAQRVPPSSSVSSVAKQLGRAMALHSHAWHTQPHWWQR